MLAPQTMSEKMRIKEMVVKSNAWVPLPVSPRVWEMIMAGKGLYDDTGQVLEVGKQHEEIGILIGFGYLGRGFLPMEDDAVLQVAFFHKRLEFWSIIVVDDVQLKVVALLP